MKKISIFKKSALSLSVFLLAGTYQNSAIAMLGDQPGPDGANHFVTIELSSDVVAQAGGWWTWIFSNDATGLHYQPSAVTQFTNPAFGNSPPLVEVQGNSYVQAFASQLLNTIDRFGIPMAAAFQTSRYTPSYIGARKDSIAATAVASVIVIGSTYVNTISNYVHSNAYQWAVPTSTFLANAGFAVYRYYNQENFKAYLIGEKSMQPDPAGWYAFWRSQLMGVGVGAAIVASTYYEIAPRFAVNNTDTRRRLLGNLNADFGAYLKSGFLLAQPSTNLASKKAVLDLEIKNLDAYLCDISGYGLKGSCGERLEDYWVDARESTRVYQDKFKPVSINIPNYGLGTGFPSSAGMNFVKPISDPYPNSVEVLRNLKPPTDAEIQQIVTTYAQMEKNACTLTSPVKNSDGSSTGTLTCIDLQDRNYKYETKITISADQLTSTANSVRINRNSGNRSQIYSGLSATAAQREEVGFRVSGIK